ncbi:SCO0930 family lipoprotein [Streptomyces sp. cmx-4-9]|uniref:SCO0930 family lipoprotein n=1 Tax=Streptomyces sp. cmx-4-9 TaxID=2790941 RepID=UPI003980558B
MSEGTEGKKRGSESLGEIVKNVRRGIFAGSAIAVLLLTAGCGSSDKASGTGNAVPVGDSRKLGSANGAGDSSDAYGAGSGYGTNPGAAPADAAGAAAAGAAAGQLKVQQLGDLGTAVTDGQGFTLYRFDKDTPNPPKSSCEGDCAKAWPPVPADEATAGEGIETGLLGSVARADGTRQLTLAGWPVYRYAKDTKAGDTLGEGVGGTWHALGPDGKPSTAAKAAPAPEEQKEEEGKEEKKEAELSVNPNAMLGHVVADAQGRTLYRFDKDSAWPMKIGCVGACVDTWKPAAPVDKAKVSGIAPELIGSVKRPDGTEQLTIDCWPVYSFTGDTQPGDIKGHNKQGLWFAVTEKGKKAKVS